MSRGPSTIARCAANDDDALESVATTGRSMNSSRRGFLSAAASIATTALSPLAGRRLRLPRSRRRHPPGELLGQGDARRASRAVVPVLVGAPLAPYGSKATAMNEVVPGQVWTFDQLQGLLDVLVNVRMTVVALQNGGLWVHNPVAPTQELMDMLAPIVAKHGPVKHIVVGSAAIEHKIYSDPSARSSQPPTSGVPQKNWTFPVDVPIDTYVPYYPKDRPSTSRWIPRRASAPCRGRTRSSTTPWRLEGAR